MAETYAYSKQQHRDIHAATRRAEVIQLAVSLAIIAFFAGCYCKVPAVLFIADTLVDHISAVIAVILVAWAVALNQSVSKVQVPALIVTDTTSV